MIGAGAALAVPVAAGIALGMSVVYLAIRPQWGDQTWLLFAARRMLEGHGMTFETLVEANPPMIVWLSVLPVWLGRALQIGLPAALQLMLATLVVLSVGWTLLLLRRLAGDGSRFAAGLLPVLLFATVVQPWLHIGQREHMMLLLMLPYLAIAAARLDGRRIAPAEAFVAGLCAGLAVMLKPHHGLMVGAVEGLVMLRAGRQGWPRSLARPETLALVVVTVGYAGALLLWAPDYLHRVVPLAILTYYDYHRARLAELMPPMRLAKVTLVLLLWLSFRRRLVHRSLAAVLALAGLGSLLGCAVQLKGHEYQFVAAIGFFYILAGVVVVDLWLSRVAARSPVALPRAAVALALSAALAAAVSLPLHLGRASNPYTDERIAVQRLLARIVPSHATVLILSTSTEAFFEQVLGSDWEWGSRFFCLWMIPGLVTAEDRADRDGRPPPAPVREAAAMTRAALSGDLARWHPNPVLVDRCQDRTLPECLGSSGLRPDLLKWLNRDDGFRSAWSEYVREGQAGPYDVWCLRGSAEVCRAIVAAVGAPSAESAAGDLAP